MLEDRPQQYMEASQVPDKETAQRWHVTKYVLFPKVRDYKRFMFRTSNIHNSDKG